MSPVSKIVLHCLFTYWDIFFSGGISLLEASTKQCNTSTVSLPTPKHIFSKPPPIPLPPFLLPSPTSLTPPTSPTHVLSHPSHHLASSNSNHLSKLTNLSLYQLNLRPTLSFPIQFLNISHNNGAPPLHFPILFVSDMVLSWTLP
jgi:hypothetical protein